jgi:hypothetical protein
LADEQGSVEVHADDRVDLGGHFVKSIVSHHSALLTMSTQPNASSADLQIAAPRVAVATVSWLAGAGQAHPLRQPEVRCVTRHSNGLP